MTSNLRTNLDKNTMGKTVHELTNKKVDLLHNSLIISNWVNEFDSKGMNNCFENDINNVPAQIKNYENRTINDL